MVTGFQSPASGYEEKGIDLNSLLIKHPNATYIMRIDTDKYRNIAIFNGDILIIDKAKAIHPSSLVVYSNQNEFRLGYVYNIHGEETHIEGCVAHVIHSVREI